jgi:hypothetical protein
MSMRLDPALQSVCASKRFKQARLPHFYRLTLGMPLRWLPSKNGRKQMEFWAILGDGNTRKTAIGFPN